ncbi:MAG: DUF4238 domain-containing protein [Paracoccaceae bacterium]|nr:DUF4238 domain-containing protein [Paracoccaceae bacterium]
MVASKRAKKHHFVPKVLQKEFCNTPNKIWYSEKNLSNGFSKPELRNIESTFRIRDYYTVFVGGRASDMVEREFYGKVDDYLGKLIPDVLSTFARKEVPIFSGNALRSVQRVVFEMIKRTPDFVKKHDEIEIGREIVERELATLSDEVESELRRSELTQELQSEAALRMLGRTVRVRACIARSKKIDDALKDFHVRWAISESKHSFVLSSLIAYRIGNGGSNGLVNPMMEIWMPISPKVALVLLRDPDGRVPNRIAIDRDKIRQVNEYAYRNCNQLGAHSEELLSSIVSNLSAM